MNDEYACDDDALTDGNHGMPECESLSEMTLEMIGRRVANLTCNSSTDEAAGVLTMVHALADAVQRLRAAAGERLVCWIEHNGELQIGPVRYYVGHRTTTKCLNVPRAVELVLAACGGELSAFSSYLSAQPFKHGACRGILSPAQWQKVFRVVEAAVLIGGQPRKQLRADNGFARARRMG